MLAGEGRGGGRVGSREKMWDQAKKRGRRWAPTDSCQRPGDDGVYRMNTKYLQQSSWERPDVRRSASWMQAWNPISFLYYARRVTQIQRLDHPVTM